MGGKATPLLSVIVPVYNVENYLRMCLDSILAQTFQDFEVICVDDGSTDHSPEILAEYAQKDERINVISQKNAGLVSARKTGAKNVSGNYVVCVDSDDWIEDTYFEELVNAREKTGVDLVIANLYYVMGSECSIRRNACREGIYRSEELWPEMISKTPFFEFGILPNLVAKLIKRSVFCECVQNIDEKIVVGEDAALSYSCLLQSLDVLVSDICGYYYVQRDNTLTKTYTNNEYERCMRLIDFLNGLDSVHHGGLKIQLEQYKKFLMLFRCPEFLDLNCSNQILEPYGGIPIGSRIVLYGAGGAGRALYSYLKASGRVEIVLWADRSFAVYQGDGLPVNSPSEMERIRGGYDFVIIAVTAEKTAEAIRRDIRLLGVPVEKIRWLTRNFIGSNSERFQASFV